MNNFSTGNKAASELVLAATQLAEQQASAGITPEQFDGIQAAFYILTAIRAKQGDSDA